jgi:signal peptidase II
VSRKNVWFAVVALVGIVLDQVTKFWVYWNLDYATESITVIPGFFDIVHAQNSGAAMGLLATFAYRRWVFLGFTVIAVGVILNMQHQLKARERFLPLVLGLIFSGAIGNAIDRVHKGTVTDFLSFNVADSALVVGVALFVIHYLFLEEKPTEAAAAAPADAAASE